MQIKKIAELAGVSKSTVSRYLNGGYVSDEKKEVIKKVIEETGYKPSSNAISLRTKVSKQIGVIIPKLNSDSISKMVSGISSILKKQGYYLILANVENNVEEEIEYLKIFSNNDVDGIILLASVFTPKHNEVMKSLHTPLVILSQYHPDFPCVYFDDRSAAKEISKHIIQGHHNPGIICSRIDDLATGYERKCGFEEAIGNSSYAIEYTDFTFEGGYNACKLLLQKNPEVDSIFCTTDSLAVGALQYLNEIGKSIPEEISIGCVGGTSITTICNPRLSVADLQYFKSGNRIAEILLNIIHQKKTELCVKTGFELSIHQTTKN